MTKSSSAETRHLQNSLYFPLAFCMVIIAIQLVPFEKCHGVSPREFSNLWGLVTSVFLHANWQHLWSNIGPLYLLLAGIFYYFPERIIVVPSIGTLLLNITVWIAAREGCHVGASGLIYFLASYLVTMAVFNKRRNLAAFVLVIVFLYGSMIWGVLPTGNNVSWESHLFGALWGIAFGIYFKRDRAWTDTIDDQLGIPQKKTEIDIAEMRIETNDAFTSYHSNSTAAMFKTSEDIDNWLNYNEIKYDFEDTTDAKSN